MNSKEKVQTITEKRKQWQKKLRWLPAIVWMGIIFYMSHQTGDEINSVLPFIQKFFPFIEDFNWGHYVSYFVLAITVDYGFGSKSSKWTVKLVIVLICTLYGITDEIHQYFVGGRMMDLYDVRNDCIGAIVWVLLSKLTFVQKIWKKLSYED